MQMSVLRVMAEASELAAAPAGSTLDRRIKALSPDDCQSVLVELQNREAQLRLLWKHIVKIRRG